MTALAPVLEAFFTERLAQRQASPHTVASYRDTFCLLLRYAREHLGKPPSRLDFADLDAPFIGAFPAHLEADRGNSITTRNNRLAAVHSLFSYAALRCPEHADLIRRVLAIPPKRTNVTIVSFLTRAETTALLAAPDPSTPLGRRDHALLLTAIQAGLHPNPMFGYVADTISTANTAGYQGVFFEQMIKTAGKLELASRVRMRRSRMSASAIMATEKAKREVIPDEKRFSF